MPDTINKNYNANVTPIMPKIWKISHGRNRIDISVKDNETLLANGYVGVGFVDPDKYSRGQRNAFISITPSDYFYLVKDSSIILLADVTQPVISATLHMPSC